jgi:ABC-type bacteriocin/lantibiotic exporter with double-glycine peptidase domain
MAGRPAFVNLDPVNERRISESLRRMCMTRVSVAHRPEICAGADRILVVARTVTSEETSDSSREFSRHGDFARAFPRR